MHELRAVSQNLTQTLMSNDAPSFVKAFPHSGMPSRRVLQTRNCGLLMITDSLSRLSLNDNLLYSDTNNNSELDHIVLEASSFFQVIQTQATLTAYCGFYSHNNRL